MNFNTKTKILFLIILFFGIFGLAKNSWAANHYINAACSSACDGSTWAKGWATFGAVTWTRGDTYYVAGGTYNENVTIAAAELGSTWMTIKKANATDNGGDAGWNSSFATNQVLVNGTLTINNGYIEINGVTGSGTSGHGIKFLAQSITTVASIEGITNVNLYYLDIRGTGFAAGATGSDGLYLYGGAKNIHVNYCWIHEITRNGITITTNNGTSWSDYALLFENSVVSEQGGCTNPDLHGQAVQISYAGSNNYLIFRNNVFRNNLGTAIFAYLGYGTHRNSRIYNNLIYITNLNTYNVISPGIVFCHDITGTSIDGIYFYNNSIYGMGDVPTVWVRGSIQCWSPSVANVEIKNNVWENSYFPSGHSGATSISNNGYYGNTGSGVPSGETNQVNGVSTTFTNPFGENFTMKTGGYAINVGLNLSSIFTTDYTGSTRLVPWDIGAYEYTGGVPQSIYCGDNSCNGTETCSTCLADCGTCPTNLPDLIITDISWSPSNPQTGNTVAFSATIKNQGVGSTPAGIIHGVLFTVDSQTYVWSDTYTSSLAPGASVTITANDGPTGTATWIATTGTHSVLANVDDVNRITESNENNNTLTETLTVGAADTTPPAAPTGVVVS